MLIERGLRAELKLESLLTGRLFVEIDFYPDSPVLYRAQPGRDFREIPTVQSKLAVLTKTIETIPFEQVVQKVTSSLDAIERLLNSPELAGSIRSLEQTLQEVKKLAGGFQGEIQKVSGTLDQTLGEARGLVQEVRKGSEHLNQLLVNLAEVTAGGDDLREELGRSLRELMEAARSLRLLAETIEARPDVFLRGKGPGTGGE
jgi:paraquat-inducible protein B